MRKRAGGLGRTVKTSLQSITQKLFWHNEMNSAMQIQKKLIPFCLSLVVLASCSDEVRRNTGRIYMPDMAYSRAYETYAVTPEQKEALLKKGIHFSNTPVAGTIKRGVLFPFDIAQDAVGDTTN